MKTLFLKIAIICLVAIAGISFKGEKQLPIIEKGDEVKTLPMANNNAFHRGELLTFRMHYGIIDAGTCSLGITDEAKEFAGRKTYHVVGLGASNGAFDFFYRVRDRYETYLDEDAIVPWMFVRHVNEGGYKIEQNYVFNHFTQKVNTGDGETYPIEPNMQDMLSAFYSARQLDLSSAKEGETYSINCFMDKEVWPLVIKFIQKETITTSLGTFRCLKFRPIVQKGRVFKHEEDLNVWITDDKNHIPILGQADVLVGSIKAELQTYAGLANPLARVE